MLNVSRGMLRKSVSTSLVFRMRCKLHVLCFLETLVQGFLRFDELWHSVHSMCLFCRRGLERLVEEAVRMVRGSSASTYSVRQGKGSWKNARHRKGGSLRHWNGCLWVFLGRREVSCVPLGCFRAGARSRARRCSCRYHTQVVTSHGGTTYSLIQKEVGVMPWFG